MARSFNPTDAHVLMNALVNQATGQTGLTVVDTSTFVSAGERVLASGVENTINSLGIVIGRTLMAVRPYKAKLAIINALNTGLYTSRLRKISYYSKGAQASGDWNTQLFTNLNMGFTNGQNPDAEGAAQSTKSMWEQNAPVVLENNFGGRSVWEDSITLYEDQLKVAFRGEAEFMEFVGGIMTERGNDIESQKEAFNRMTLLNHIAGVYDLSASMPKSAVNLTALYNETYDTTYTSEELRTTYLADFLKFFVAQFKLASDYMTNRSSQYHWSPAKSVGGVDYVLLRHTPKNKQRAMLFNPLFVNARANVLPDIFNPQYLDINNFEPVDYWQSFTTPAAINVTPAIPDVSGTGASQTVGAPVSIPYVVGVLFDEDAVMVDYQLESSNTTPLEARKRYRNLWWTFSKNAINDFTENFVLFYMAD